MKRELHLTFLPKDFLSIISKFPEPVGQHPKAVIIGGVELV